MGAVSTSDFRAGLKIEIDGDPYIIVDYQHVKPGKGGAFVRTRLRNMKTGNNLDRTFRSGEKFDLADMNDREVQFLYRTGDTFHFMDTQNYEQLSLTPGQVGPAQDFLKEETVIQIAFYKGSPMSVTLPTFVNLRIVETVPGVRGDTATGSTKSAKVETGGVVKVPLYMEEGVVIKIDTRTGTYIERV